MKPGAASFPFFGVQLELLDEKGKVVSGALFEVFLSLCLMLVAKATMPKACCA